jgi:type II secretory pathway component PulM
MIIYYWFILVAAVMLPKKGKRGSNRTAPVETPLNTQEALAAAVRVMQQELATLRQATHATTTTIVTTSATPAASTIPATHTVPSGVP